MEIYLFITYFPDYTERMQTIAAWTVAHIEFDSVPQWDLVPKD